MFAGARGARLFNKGGDDNLGRIGSLQGGCWDETEAVMLKT